MAKRLSPPAFVAVGILVASCSGTEAGSADTTPPATTTTVVSSTVATPTSTPLTTTPTSSSPTDVESELDAALAAWHAPEDPLGVVVTMVGPDGFSWTGTAGLADRTAGTAIPADGLFEIGSITKPLVAAAAFALADAGEIDLDVPVGAYLPNRGLDGVTLRSLLAHTAGLEDIDVAGTFVGSELPDLQQRVDPADLVDAAIELVPDELVTRYSYSNAGYWLVGAAIEGASGRTLSAVLRSEVIEPAGLESTFLAWDEPLPGDLVTGYFDIFGTGNEIGLGTEPIPAMITGAWAAGGIVATADDVATFFDALFGGQIVEDVAAMLDSGAGAQHGLGLSKTIFPGGEAWGHNGGIPGYTTSAYHDLETGYSVAVMTNRFGLGGPDTERLAGILLSRVRSHS